MFRALITYAPGGKGWQAKWRQWKFVIRCKMKFTRRARYNGSSRSKRIAFCSREPRIRQFRSPSCVWKMCRADLSASESPQKLVPSLPPPLPSLSPLARVYNPKCVAKIYSQLPVCSIEFKRIQRFNDFTILATVRDCKDLTDPKPQVFKDLKLRNAELFGSKSLQRAPFLFIFFFFLSFTLEYIAVNLIYLLCKCSSMFKDLKI